MGRHHSGNDARQAVNIQPLSYYFRIGSVLPAPERVAQYGQRLARLVVSRIECTADLRWHVQRGKEVCCYSGSVDALCLAAAREIHRAFAIACQMCETASLTLEFQEIGRRKSFLTPVRNALV